MNKTKSFEIPKQLIYDAFQFVKENQGSAGVDEVSIAKYESNLKNNLYQLWNRLSSGSYMPPAVKAVEIPKKSGGIRVLGIPTVSDRIAQTAVKMRFEGKVEPFFLVDSFGYRPGKFQYDAIKVTRERCWKYNWVLEFDIKALLIEVSKVNSPHRYIAVG